MARLDDIKMMLSSLLKIKEPEQKVQDESEKSLKAEDGFDNDNPLAHTSLCLLYTSDAADETHEV